MVPENGAILTQTQLNPGFALMKKGHRCGWQDPGSKEMPSPCLFSKLTSMPRLFHPKKYPELWRRVQTSKNG